MIAATDIEQSPDWLPHAIDLTARRVEFLRIAPETYREPGFLADAKPASAQDRAALGFDEVQALRPETGPLHFIFHTAFCRSTLLARALNIPGVSCGLSEPGIFVSLANAGQAGAPLIAPILRLLARKRPGGEAVFVKPTNHTNRLIPALIEAAPDARAILMTNPLDVFLRSVARKGMMGRRWGRQLFLEMQTYAGMDFGMDQRESFSMTDMQAAGLAWFLNQNYFAALLASRHGARMRVLDGERFNAERARTLASALDLAGHPMTLAKAKRAAQSDIFASHSKKGGAFDARADDALSGIDPALAEEIAQVSEWVAMIAQQLPHAIPLRHTLFPVD